MHSSSSSLSLPTSTGSTCEKPAIPTTLSSMAPPPHRPKRPRYVSFVSPEFISPELDRKRSWTHRWPLLLIRISILIVAIFLLDLFVQFTHICGSSHFTTFAIICGILSWITSLMYILSWVRGRISQCHSIGVANSSGAAVDPEASEGSPLVHHVTKKRSRRMVHLTIHLGLFLMWSAIIIHWIVRRLEGSNIFRFVVDYSTETAQKCSELSGQSFNLILMELVLWVLATIFIWVDIRRRAF